MSERTFNRIVVTVGALLLGYMLLAGPITQRAQQREEEPMPTQGQAAFGTTLYRDGVAVAEIVALHEVGARDAATINLTSHDSAERFGEVIQGLRERRKFAVLGNHLPEQTGTWVADFMDGDTLHGYTIVFPTGERIAFLGFLTQVRVQGEIGGRLYWDAVIVPTPSGEYWHCTGAPGAPGIPPPGDPDHWEPATLAEAEAGTFTSPVFGQAGVLTAAAGAASSIVGTVFPFPSGDPTRSVTASGSWPDWPDPATLNDEYVAHCYSINCAYDAATNRALTINAYLEYGEGDGGPTDSVRAAIYRASDGAFLGATEAQLVTQGAPAAWYAFSFGEAGPVLVPATEYALVVWGQGPSGMDTSLWGGALNAYEAPPAPVTEVPDWDDETEYVYCNYVYYPLSD